MSWFSRKEKSSMGAPMNLRCASCGMALHGGTGAVLMGGADVIEHLTKKAGACQACHGVYCPECCYQAGKRRGRSAACPACGGEVS